MKITDKFAPHEVNALVRFKAENGRTWRKKLEALWKSGRAPYPLCNLAVKLRSIGLDKVVLPAHESLWLDLTGPARRTVMDITGIEPPMSRAGIRVKDCFNTGKRSRQWWGGMDGGPANFEVWEATVSDEQYTELNGRSFLCYRNGTSEMCHNPSVYLTPFEEVKAGIPVS